MANENRQHALRSGTYAVKVQGCKVSTYEAEQIRRRLDLNGMRPADPGEGADMVLVHIWAVTSTAVRKTRQAVRRPPCRRRRTTSPWTDSPGTPGHS